MQIKGSFGRLLNRLLHLWYTPVVGFRAQNGTLQLDLLPSQQERRFKVFISYPGGREDIAENLRDALNELWINAWVYSEDRLLGQDMWSDIRSQIEEARVVIFLVSAETGDSAGQRQELELAYNQVKGQNAGFEIFPMLLDESTAFHSLPEPLQKRNGLRLNGRNVRQIAFRIASRFFPNSVEKWTSETRWLCPRPGDWLQVCRLDSAEVEEYFELGDPYTFASLVRWGYSSAIRQK